jgi:hypothetical protein
MTATKRKSRTTKATTNSDRRVLDLPYASTKDFELVIENVINELHPSGQSPMYGLRNKITDVIEARGLSLAVSVMVMQNQQQMFDKVLSGEMNGYASAEGKTALPTNVL